MPDTPESLIAAWVPGRISQQQFDDAVNEVSPQFTSISQQFVDAVAALLSSRYGGQSVAEPNMKMLADQNALITEGFRRIRQGKWEGADGLDAIIVALQGGKPLDFTPSFPPKH